MISRTFFGQSHVSKNPMSISCRFLRVLAHATPEVVIGGNSVIFFTKASLRHHPEGMHSQLHLINTGHWLDQLHPDYDHLKWGQALWGMPWFVREDFLRLFPTHQKDDQITFGQMKTLREAVLDDLKQQGAQVYSGVPEIHRTHTHYEVKLGEDPLLSEENILFYHAWRSPRTHHGLGDHLPAQSHVQLYHQPRSTLPKTVILLGGGRSSVWAAQNFPEIQFHCISQKSMLPLFRDETPPANMTLYTLDSFSGSHPRHALGSGENHPGEALILTNDAQGTHYTYGDFYCAIGMTQHPEVTATVQPMHLVYYPNQTWSQKWTAPTEIPAGSLMEATSRWAAVTGNLSWAEEPGCFHGAAPDCFVTRLRDHLDIPETFYDLLRQSLTQQETSLSDEACLQLYSDCLEKACEQAGVPYLKDTEKTLKKVFEQRIQYLSSFTKNDKDTHHDIGQSDTNAVRKSHV